MTGTSVYVTSMPLFHVINVLLAVDPVVALVVVVVPVLVLVAVLVMFRHGRTQPLIIA